MVDQLGEALHKLMHSYRSTGKQIASESGIDLPFTHIRSLKCIKHIENCSATDISKKLAMDKSQVTRIIKDLLSNHYIEKHQCPINHRVQRLTLSDKGNNIINKVKKIERITQEKMSLNLTKEQIENFINIAETMKSNLQD